MQVGGKSDTVDEDGILIYVFSDSTGKVLMGCLDVSLVISLLVVYPTNLPEATVAQ
jgi:hypothetical protein